MSSDDDVDSVIMLSIAATYNFYYVMGYTTAAPTPSAVGDVRALHVKTNSSAVEMVFAKGVSDDFICTEDGWSEQQWEQFVEDKVQGKILRVQTACVVSMDAGGAACIDRLIELQTPSAPSNALLNCYREASGGRMHYLDRRPWKMSTISQLSMEFELSSTKQRIAFLTIKARDTTARIQYTYAALQCARIIDDAIVEVLEEDMHKLESVEAEIMSEVANLHDAAYRHTSVLQFQQQLSRIASKKRGRSDDDDDE
jgi:hypothetical protein